MRRFSLLASTAVGISIGGVLFNAAPAYADLPTIDFAAIAQAIQSNSTLASIYSTFQTVSTTINDVKTFANNILNSLGDNTFGTVQSLLQQGFTQNANYSKAAINASGDIADASNAAMAAFQLQVRQAQIRDQHTVSPEACNAVDDGVSTTAASVQGFSVAYTIGRIHSARGRADPGMPSYFGAAQGVASMSQQHRGLYCDQKDVAAGLCPAPSPHPDADSDASSFYGNNGTYADQAAINAAKDFATNLIQPIAPAALRGSQLNSVEGEDAAVRRRSYDARMSLAFSVIDDQIGMRAPSVPVTAAQTAYLTTIGLTAPLSGNISWYTATQIEAQRRTGVSWAATLQGSPPATVMREIALEMATANYLAFQNFKQGQQHNALLAALLAERVDRNFNSTSPLPIPDVN